MSIAFTIRRDGTLGNGRYPATLESLEEKETVYGERLLWLFFVEDPGVEVAGFTSRSPSAKAKPYRWATALNEEIATKSAWGAEDVIGRQCLITVETYEDGQGRQKSKVVKVEPLGN